MVCGDFNRCPSLDHILKDFGLLPQIETITFGRGNFGNLDNVYTNCGIEVQPMSKFAQGKDHYGLSYRLHPHNKDSRLSPGVVRSVLPPDHVLKPMLKELHNLITVAKSNWPFESAKEALSESYLERPATVRDIKVTNLAQAMKMAHNSAKALLPYENFVLLEQARERNRIVGAVNRMRKEGDKFDAQQFWKFTRELPGFSRMHTAV